MKKNSKVVGSIKEAIQLAGLKDGMRISFHHHFRNGDYIMNMVFAAIEELGIKDLTVNCTGSFDIQNLTEAAEKKIMTGFEGTGVYNKKFATLISQGKLLDKPIMIDSHGGRTSQITTGKTPIDVAFLGAPTCDTMGNFSGKYGPSACGTISYAIADSQYASKVIAITDNLVEYPLADFTVPETLVDYVVKVDKIGDPSGIVSGVTRITRDPMALRMAKYVAKVIRHSGLLEEEESFGFQTGGGSISLAAAKFLKDELLDCGVQGDFIMGGTTGYLVDMLEEGCFRTILDAQCLDLRAVESIAKNPNHREISIAQYASPTEKSCVVDSLSAAILGATEVDTDFNCNALTDSNGYLMAAIGGHQDVAAGAKMGMMVAPLSRARLPIIRDKLTTLVTPGNTVDVVVTQAGIAVNPKHPELKARLLDAGLPIVDIHDLKKLAEELTGVPEKCRHGDKEVCKVMYRGMYQIDSVYNVIE